MGSKLSFYKRTAETNEDQVSEALNNLKVSDPAETEPTPISADNTEKVEPKCRCVDCKCHPCNCAKKELPTDEPKSQTLLAPEQDVIQTPASNEEPVPQSTEPAKEVIAEQEKPSEAVKPETTVAEVTNEEKRCLCDPCQCNPCKCCGHEVKHESSDVSPQNDSNESQKQNQTQESQQQTDQPLTETQAVQQSEADINRQVVNQESEQNSSPVEESRGNEEQPQNLGTNTDSVSEPVEQINDNVETQEPSQALDIQ